MVATDHGHLACVNLLLRFGDVDMPLKQVNLKDKHDGNTALMFGAFRGNARICSALLRAGAAPKITDKYGQTPLNVALHRHPANHRLHALLRGESHEAACDACHMPASHAPKGKLLVCSACQGAHYCCKQCQAAAWPGHKAECNQRRDARAEGVRKQFVARPGGAV